jgi:DNA topoisomerase-1
LLHRCHDVPGQQLFQYYEGGRRRDVDSADVNAYLRQVCRADITAKVFRTWTGTVCTAMALWELGDFDTLPAGRANLAEAVRRAARELRNTPAVCRKYYVHPAITDAYLDRTLLAVAPRSPRRPAPFPLGLTSCEKAVLSILRT